MATQAGPKSRRAAVSCRTWACYPSDGPAAPTPIQNNSDLPQGLAGHAVRGCRVAFPHFCEPCLPSPAEKPPAGAGWLHEIKHDGFRMLVRRDGAGVRLFTRNGHDWTGRFPLIARAALSLKATSCLIDGEAVACDGDGMPVFD